MSNTATKITDADRKFVMSFAWSSKREEPARSFADCLRGACAYLRRSLAHAVKFMAKARRSNGVVSLRPIAPTYARRLTADARQQARIGF